MRVAPGIVALELHYARRWEDGSPAEVHARTVTVVDTNAGADTGEDSGAGDGTAPAFEWAGVCTGDVNLTGPSGMSMGSGDLELTVTETGAFSGSSTLASFMPISLAIEGSFDDELNAEGTATYGSGHGEATSGSIGLEGITREWATPEAATTGRYTALVD